MVEQAPWELINDQFAIIIVISCILSVASGQEAESSPNDEGLGS